MKLFRNKINNVSYQSLKFRFLPVFLLISALLFLVSCNRVQKSRSVPVHADSLFSSGEFIRLKVWSDSLQNEGKLTDSEVHRIDSLLETSHRIHYDFRLTEDEVKSRLINYYPNLDSIQLHQWETGLKLEMRLIDGEKRYFRKAVSNLFRLDDTVRNRKIEVDGFQADSLKIFCRQHTRKIISGTKTSGELSGPVRMNLTYSIVVEPNAVPSGETIRCWMPFPREGNVRQKNIRLLKSEPEEAVLAPESDLQRALYLEKKATQDQSTTFRIEFEVETSAQYFRLNPEDIKPYDTTGSVFKENTRECSPQILFTPKIKQLAGRILAGETNPLIKVQKIYDWISDSIPWASALEYSIIPDIPGYVIETRHGDCGMQTLLFMTLARSQGIPVKWQSGWMLHPREVNLHDWCEVYYEGIGWVPLDQSFGLQDSAEDPVRNFYRSGIDSYRLIVNDDYGRELSPKKKFMRSEPYDFQRGELEWEGGNLYFDRWKWHMEVEYK